VQTWPWAVAKTRNYAGRIRRKGGDVRDSYERAALGDTVNTRRRSVTRAGVVIRLTQVVAACGGRGVPRRAIPRARSHSNADLTHSCCTARYPPPPNPRARRHSRNHGRPLRGLAAVRNHDRLLRIQRRVRRKAQGDAERRKEDQAGHRRLGQANDGARPPPDWLCARTDRQARGAGRL